MDQNSGMKVTAPLDGKSNQVAGSGRCADGYRLPSGYPVKGWAGLPNEDSDFVTLISDGVLQVVPGMKGHWFWSSSFFTPNLNYAWGLSEDSRACSFELGCAHDAKNYKDGKVVCVK